MKAVAITIAAIFSVLLATVLTPRVGAYTWIVYLATYVLLMSGIVAYGRKRFDARCWLMCLGFVVAPFVAFAPCAIFMSHLV